MGRVIGGSGADTLLGTDDDNTWTLTGIDAGIVAGVDFPSIENLTGGAGADTFVVTEGAGLTGLLDGGGGVNSLDYSGFSTGCYGRPGGRHGHRTGRDRQYSECHRRRG